MFTKLTGCDYYNFIIYAPARDGKRGGNREDTSQKVSRFGRKFTEKYICHSFRFHVSEEIQFLSLINLNWLTRCCMCSFHLYLWPFQSEYY